MPVFPPGCARASAAPIAMGGSSVVTSSSDSELTSLNSSGSDWHDGRSDESEADESEADGFVTDLSVADLGS